MSDVDSMCHGGWPSLNESRRFRLCFFRGWPSIRTKATPEFLLHHQVRLFYRRAVCIMKTKIISEAKHGRVAQRLGGRVAQRLAQRNLCSWF
jgi:hypothetical protein